MFAQLTLLVEQASEKVKDMSAKGVMLVQQSGVLDLLDLTSDSQSTASSIDAAPPNAVLTLTTADILQAPLHWDGSEAEWQLLQRAALRNVDYIACLPATLAHDENAPSWLSIVQLLHLSSEEAARMQKLAICTDATYVPQADLVDWLLTQHDIRVVRSLLVPRFISDDAYWHVLGWKTELQHHCRDATELLSLLRLLAPPMTAYPWPADREGDATGQQTEHEVEDDAMRSDTDDADDEAEEATSQIRKHEPVVLENKVGCATYWSNVECSWRVLSEGQAWQREEIAKVQRAVSVARHTTAQLTQLDDPISPRSTALLEAVRESCEFHKLKLTRLMSEVHQAQDRLRGTELDASTGDLFAALTHVVDEVAAALARQTTARETDPMVGVCLDERATMPQLSACLSASRGASPVLVDTNAPPTGDVTTRGAVTLDQSAVSTRQDTSATMNAPSTAAPKTPLAGASVTAETTASPVEDSGDDDVDHNDPEGSDNVLFEAKLPWDDGVNGV